MEVPNKHRVIGLFEAAYVNFEDVSMLHRDSKDFRWCITIPYGDFQQGLLDFPFLNTTVDVKRGDICLFWSKRLWHTLKKVIGKRKVVVITNHTAVVQRFVDISSINNSTY